MAIHDGFYMRQGASIQANLPEVFLKGCVGLLGVNRVSLQVDSVQVQ